MQSPFVVKLLRDDGVVALAEHRIGANDGVPGAEPCVVAVDPFAGDPGRGSALVASRVVRC